MRWKSLLLCLVLITVILAGSVAGDNPPWGFLAVWPSGGPALIGEQIEITVNGRDDIDVAKVSAWYGNTWHHQSCSGTQTECIKFWDFSESTTGTYEYCGYVLDSSSQESWTDPQCVYVNVVECRIDSDCNAGKTCENGVCVASQDNPPWGFLAVWPSGGPALIGEQIEITVNGRDDIDVAKVSAWYGNTWHHQSCSGTQTECIKFWDFSESTTGTYEYCGYVLDSSSQESWTDPQCVYVNVVECRIDSDCNAGKTCEDGVCVASQDNPPSGTLSYTPATPCVGQPMYITINGYDDIDMAKLEAEYGGLWHSHQCTGTSTTCSNTWTYVPPTEGTYHFSGKVYDSADQMAYTSPASTSFWIGECGTPPDCSIDIEFDKAEYCVGDEVVITLKFKHDGDLTDPSWRRVLVDGGDYSDRFTKKSEGIQEARFTMVATGTLEVDAEATIEGCEAEEENSVEVVYCGGDCSVEIKFDKDEYCEGDTFTATLRFRYDGKLTDPSWYRVILYNPYHPYPDGILVTNGFERVTTGVYEWSDDLGIPGTRRFVVEAIINGCEAEEENSFKVVDCDTTTTSSTTSSTSSSTTSSTSSSTTSSTSSSTTSSTSSSTTTTSDTTTTTSDTTTTISDTTTTISDTTTTTTSDTTTTTAIYHWVYVKDCTSGCCGDICCGDTTTTTTGDTTTTTTGDTTTTTTGDTTTTTTINTSECLDKKTMDNCLDITTCYWDQETDSCRVFDSTKQPCSDPDNGKDYYTQAHTYGFRKHAANERDARIRTGGKDACIGDKLREHYCVDTYYIETIDITCPTGYGCKNGACVIPTECGDLDNCHECLDNSCEWCDRELPWPLDVLESYCMDGGCSTITNCALGSCITDPVDCPGTPPTTTTTTISDTTTTISDTTTTTTSDTTTTTTIPADCHSHSNPTWVTDSKYNIKIIDLGCTQTGCAEGGGESQEALIEIREGPHCGEQFWIWIDLEMTPNTPNTGSCYEAHIFTTLYGADCGHVIRYLMEELDPCPECPTTTTTTISDTTTTTSDTTTTTPPDTTTTTISDTTTTTITPGKYSFNSFVSSPIEGGYRCNLDYENSAGEDIIILFLFKNTKTGKIVTVSTSVAPEGTGTASGIIYCSTVEPGDYEVSWRAYLESDPKLEDPIAWSKSTEVIDITCPVKP